MLRPDERLSGWRAVRGQFSFSSTREIAQGLRFGTRIEATEVDERLVQMAPELGIAFGTEGPGLRIGDVSVRASGVLYDDRIRLLSARAQDRDIADLAVFDFDIHAAVCVAAGRPLSAWPHVTARDFDKRIAPVLQHYAGMVDQVREYFGVCDRTGFERMGLWLLENKQARASGGNVLGAVFAADLYGDKALASQMLDDLEADWVRRMSSDKERLLVQQVGKAALEDIGRARRMIAS